MNNRNITLLCLLLLSITILWITGPFADVDKSADGPLSTSVPPAANSTDGASSGKDATTPGEGTAAINPSDGKAYKYEKVTITTPDGPQVIHFLEVDLTNPRVVVKPVSSHPTLFGYEYLSVMASKSKASAAVNAGFSYPDGLPGGMFYSNKILKTPASGRFPVLFLMDGRAVISDALQSVNIKSGGSKMESVFFNCYSNSIGTYAFTPVFGSTDRVGRPHLCAVVQNGKVTDIVRSDTAVDIPGDGFLVDAIGPDAEKKLQAFLSVDASLELATDLKTPEELQGEYLSAYECGSRLIRDGKDVCPEYDPWAGGLTSREPRSAVGIKSDGTLVFAVVDGRGKDSSIGVTGRELVKILLDRDVAQAALLDGGASSEMIVDGAIVNSPSAGRERLLPACFAVYVN